MHFRHHFFRWSFFIVFLLVVGFGFGAPLLVRWREEVLASAVASWQEGQVTESTTTSEELYEAVRETHDLPPMDELTFEEETDTSLRFSYERFSPKERFVFQEEEHVLPEGVYTHDVVFRRVNNQWVLEQF